MKATLQDGRQVDAEEVDFEVTEEAWNAYKLKDGTLLKVRIVLTGVCRTKEHDPNTGSPYYFIQHQALVRTGFVPNELKAPLVMKPKKNGVEVA